MSTLIKQSSATNDLMVFNNDQFLIEAREINGNIEFKADGVAKSLGWSYLKKDRGNKEFIRWETINGYLLDFGLSQEVATGDFIPEQYVYLLGMKAKSDIAMKFQKWLAFEVLPSLRKHGAYISENADEEYVKNELRFSQNRTIKTFSTANVSDLKKIYSEFKEYVDDEYKYKTDQRLARYKSVEKGLDILHDELAKDVSNIGDCYNIRKLKEKVIIDRTTLEKRISGGDKAAKTKKIKNLETENVKLTCKLENSIIYPDKSKFTTLSCHGISNNYLFEQVTTDFSVKTDTYKKWINNFPKWQMPSKESWDIDWNKPIELFLHYIAIDKIDTSNCDKAIIDMIIERCYGENDNIVHTVHSERIGTCDKYWDGKISFYIKNKD